MPEIRQSDRRGAAAEHKAETTGGERSQPRQTRTRQGLVAVVPTGPEGARARWWAWKAATDRRTEAGMCDRREWVWRGRPPGVSLIDRSLVEGVHPTPLYRTGSPTGRREWIRKPAQGLVSGQDTLVSGGGSHRTGGASQSQRAQRQRAVSQLAGRPGI